MSPPLCLCDATFGTIYALKNHATSRGHLFECECGTLFSTEKLLKDHQQHGYWDICNATSFTELKVKGPRGKKILNRFYCGICRNTHYGSSKQRDEHLASTHNACPTCFETFPSLVNCMEHQASANHCYCSDHELAFPRFEELLEHVCADEHNEGILCMCHEIFYSDGDYDRHLNNHHRNHVDDEAGEKARLLEPTYAEEQLARVEYDNLWCKECDWHFVSVEAYLQHKSSSRHEIKLLVLDCRCGKSFNLMSALIQHLESGGCRSGMTREILNGIVYLCDKDHRITKAAYADRFSASTIAGTSKSSIAPDDSASMLEASIDHPSIDANHTGSVEDQVSASGFLTSDGSEFTVSDDNKFVATPSASDKSCVSSDCIFITTPTASAGTSTPTAGSHVDTGTFYITNSSDSDDDIIVIPPGSSAAGSSDEWAFVKQASGPSSVDDSSVATFKFDMASKSWPCTKCPRTFPAKQDLFQHMASASHDPRIFNSPTDIFDWSGDLTSKRDFKTASGMLQHAERESSKGDKADMETIVGIVQKPIDKNFKASMRSLELEW